MKHARATTLLIALAALVCGLAAFGAPDGRTLASVQGDADCDSDVDSADALQVLRDVAGLPSSAQCLPSADVDCDGGMTSLDALGILRHAARLDINQPPGCAPIGSTPQATPSPTATGSDPTATPGLTPTPTDAPENPTPTATPARTPRFSATPTHTPTPTPSRTPTATPADGALNCSVFPPDNWWNTDVSQFPVHEDSDTFVNAVGRWDHLHPDFGTFWENAPIGIPYVIVGGGQPKVPVSFYYDGESDPGPYPIPADAPIEGGLDSNGDRHVLVVDDDNCVLYETYDSWPVAGGAAWEAGSGAIFDLTSNNLRPDTWTSADAAGLPIFAGLVRYDEVMQDGVIDHALRFTVSATRRAFMHPATHYASDSTDPTLPPMGLRFRMQAGYDCSGFSHEAQVVCAALKKYGMFVADNGSDWFISGAHDPRWDDDALGDLKQIPGDAFDVVDTGESVITG